MNSRTKLLDDVCNSRNFTSKKNYLRTSNLYWLKNENIAYCPIFKSSTSTWRTHLVNALNNTYTGNRTAIISKNSGKDIGLHEKLMQLGAIKPKSKTFC